MSRVSIDQSRRVSSAAQWAKTLASFALVLACTASVGHRYTMVETVAFFWVLALVAGLAVLALLGAAVGFARLWTNGDKAGKASLAAIFLALIVLTPFGIAGYLAYALPPLTDISTDLTEPPPLVRAARLRTADMNPIQPLSQEAIAAQRLAYPDVAGRRFDGSMERVINAVQVVLTAHGWQPKAPWPSELQAGDEIVLELDAPSFILRLPADAVLRLTDEGESVFLDMRLNARYGPHDLGDNARRIRSFMNDVDAEFARQSLLIIDIPASSEGENPVK